MRPFLWLAGSDRLPAAFNSRPACVEFPPHGFCATCLSGDDNASGKPNGVALSAQGCADRNHNASTGFNHCYAIGHADNGSRRDGQR